MKWFPNTVLGNVSLTLSVGYGAIAFIHQSVTWPISVAIDVRAGYLFASLVAAILVGLFRSGAEYPWP